MASRPRGYGLTAELSNKIASKYSQENEQEARLWIEDVIGEAISSGDRNTPLGMKGFHEALKDGRILCRLINVLQPNSVKKINDSKMAFKMMENIGNFLEACERYGVNKVDLFQTVDLYESQNMASVVNGIHALGRMAQKKGFHGPVLGPKEASSNVREFTEEQMKAGQGVIGLQMGTNKGASQAGMSFGKTRHIID
ncbi:muscle-specific protein 20 isoform X2 [Lingula anatina]|uniref:Transgelin n=1 Tax=Lingula anatina TaxID=7574 RepID=A0A1S3KEG8_LINAN|nr:muscle-specific protein 20 isoform X2 [Lingula anatina]|eukprot:XP_013421025.1 muscle-specific protein 20 isoform X2 [Lingula anatina]